jgi:hypothetical protein
VSRKYLFLLVLLAGLGSPSAAQPPAAPTAPTAEAADTELERLIDTALGLRTGLASISKDKQPQEWQMAQRRLGDVLAEAAAYLDGAARTKTLREAIAANRAALEVLDSAREPQEWSIAKYNLGRLHLELAEMLEGEAAAAELRAAIAAFEPLPKFFPPDKGMLRAASLALQGEALLGLGSLLPGDEGRLRVERAVQVFAEAEAAVPADAAAVQRGMTIHGRARATAELATRQPAGATAGTRGQAVAAYEEAAKIFTRERDLELFVQIQQELGILQLQSAVVLRGPESVAPATAAADSFRQALSVVAREGNPELWGSLQGGLGAALLRAGKSSPAGDAGAVAQLEASAAAFENLLAVLPREKDPQAWAQTQHNLGTALRELGTRRNEGEGIAPLRRSMAAYKSALAVITREQDEAAWAESQFNLVLAMHELARRLEPDEASDLVDEASDIMAEAKPVLDRLGTAGAGVD